MKRPIIVVTIVVSLLLVYCSSKRNNTSEVGENVKKSGPEILHLPSDGEDTLKVSFFADTVLYVPLETTQESYIDNITQIWTNDSIILISCYQNGMLMFGIDGKFIRKIGKTGRGPAEYGGILHFNVSDDTIYISSTGRHGFLRYTFSGKYCDEIKLDFQPVFFDFTVDGKLACYNKAEGIVLVYNENFSNADTLIVEYDVSPKRYNFIYGDPLYMTYLQKTSSGLLFNNYMSDTIWNIVGNKKEPACIHDMGKLLLPNDKQVELYNGNFEYWSSIAKSYKRIHLIQFSSLVIGFQKYWTDPNYDAIYLFELESGVAKRFNCKYMYDDIVGKQRLSPVFMTYSNKYLLVDASDSGELGEKKEEIIEKNPSPLWIEQMKNVNENDNPILALIRIKK